MNIGFKFSLTFLILAIFSAFVRIVSKTSELDFFILFFGWLTLIAAVVGAIMKIWQKK